MAVHLGGQPGAVCLVGDVAGQGGYAVQPAHRVGQLAWAAGIDHEGPAAAGQGVRGGLAQAHGRAGDHGSRHPVLPICWLLPY